MTTHIAFGRASALGERLLALVSDASLTSETVAPAATSTATAPDLGGDAPLAMVTTDTAVYVAFGTAPNAGANPRFFVPANSVTFFVVKKGYKAAVAAAS